jgi:hypothetical protein
MAEQNEPAHGLDRLCTLNILPGCRPLALAAPHKKRYLLPSLRPAPQPAHTLYYSLSHVPYTDPNTTTLKAQFFPEHKSQRVMIRYGPFTAPPMSEHNGMKNFNQRVAQVPCTDCLVTWMQAGLMYEDGSEADADT